MEVAAIVLSSLSLVGSIVSPLIVAIAYFINRIKVSDCCGSHVELTPQQTQPINPPISLQNHEQEPNRLSQPIDIHNYKN